MDALSHLRHLIAALDTALVDSLCARARQRLNESLYALPDESVPDLQVLAGHFADTPTLAGRVQLLRPAYILCLLPGLCEPGQDEGPSVLAADQACLDALARRLALSVHVATRKREALPDALQAAIRTGDPVQVEQAITHPAVEKEVLARVKARAAECVADHVTPARIASAYADWVIPLSRKIQVYGLLARS